MKWQFLKKYKILLFVAAMTLCQLVGLHLIYAKNETPACSLEYVNELESLLGGLKENPVEEARYFLSNADRAKKSTLVIHPNSSLSERELLDLEDELMNLKRGVSKLPPGQSMSIDMESSIVAKASEMLSGRGVAHSITIENGHSFITIIPDASTELGLKAKQLSQHYRARDGATGVELTFQPSGLRDLKADGFYDPTQRAIAIDYNSIATGKVFQSGTVFKHEVGHAAISEIWDKQGILHPYDIQIQATKGRIPGSNLLQNSEGYAKDLSASEMLTFRGDVRTHIDKLATSVEYARPVEASGRVKISPIATSVVNGNIATMEESLKYAQAVTERSSAVAKKAQTVSTVVLNPDEKTLARYLIQDESSDVFLTIPKRSISGLSTASPETLAKLRLSQLQQVSDRQLQIIGEAQQLITKIKIQTRILSTSGVPKESSETFIKAYRDNIKRLQEIWAKSRMDRQLLGK